MTTAYIERVAATMDLSSEDRQRLQQHLGMIEGIRARLAGWVIIQAGSAIGLGLVLVVAAMVTLVPGIDIAPDIGLALTVIAIGSVTALAAGTIVARQIGEELHDAKAHCLGFLASR